MVLDIDYIICYVHIENITFFESLCLSLIFNTKTNSHVMIKKEIKISSETKLELQLTASFL